ncbi:metallophosphoesterase [Candidatus Saccharibacteria bacterium]|nr:metallophosphoesterase [Candidatus Saccharibacteria bacterium]
MRSENTVLPSLPLSGDGFFFSAAGDFGNNANADKVLRAIGKTNSSFTLALGDLGYVGNGNESGWCEFVKDRVGDEHPFEIIAGNHDDGSTDGNILAYRKCLPNKINNVVGEYGIEYYFDYENLARIILISPDIATYGFSYTEGSSHLQWVIDTIRDAKDKQIPWVILGMHKNCITPGVKNCEIGPDLLNEAVRNGVDIILQGHEHAYFRSKQLFLNTNTCPVIVVSSYNESCIANDGNELRKGAGTVIIISGAGGYELRPVNINDPELGYFSSINSSDNFNAYGFSLFTVKEDELDISFFPTTGDFEDTFRIARY